MNCIVTAGPTYEPLDQVRRLTNFSSGTLGSELANFLVTEGHQVTLLRGYYSVHQGAVKAHKVIQFETTADLSHELQSLAGESIGAVFHAAAVSDFRFGRAFKRSGSSGQLAEVRAGKLSTGRGTLLVELIPTPKILPELRTWFPHAQLVGWKYEVDGTRAEAIAVGEAQIGRCGTDACVVNGPAYGEGFGLVAKGAGCAHVADAAALYKVLAGQLKAKPA